MNQNTDCPECGADVPVAADVLLNEILPCSDCGAELEIIQTSPLQIDLAPEIEEDWGE